MLFLANVLVFLPIAKAVKLVIFPVSFVAEFLTIKLSISLPFVFNEIPQKYLPVSSNFNSFSRFLAINKISFKNSFFIKKLSQTVWMAFKPLPLISGSSLWINKGSESTQNSVLKLSLKNPPILDNKPSFSCDQVLLELSFIKISIEKFHSKPTFSKTSDFYLIFEDNFLLLKNLAKVPL